jgi:hypothetical protein
MTVSPDLFIQVDTSLFTNLYFLTLIFPVLFAVRLLRNLGSSI